MTYEFVVKFVAIVLVLGTPRVWFAACKRRLKLDLFEWLQAEFDPTMEHHA